MAKKGKKSTTTKRVKHQFAGKLSLVIPCYNEQKRIKQLHRALQEFDQKWNQSAEIIIVDDGSSDGSAEAIDSTFSGTFSDRIDFQLLALPENQGKGGALKAGVEAATGDFILTMDADVATHPLNLQKWLKELPGKTFNEEEILIGSREHEDSEVEGNFIRRIAGLIFNLIIQVWTGLNLADTQCGYKLYPSKIGKLLFSQLKTNGWAHDVELLYYAKLHDISIKPMPVQWTHQDDSKINLASDSFKMLMQTIAISTRLRIKYYILDPIRELSSGKAFGQKDPSYYRLLFVLLSAALLFLMPMLSSDFGYTGDELVQKEYGEKVLAYFETGGENTEALEYRNLYYYGGLFDYWAAKLSGWFPNWDAFDLRHWVNALFGFVMMLFTGLLARNLSGSWRIAFFALLFVALSPRIFGHSMNNPKDIPFAAAYAFSMVYMIRFLKNMPNPGSANVLLLILGIAAAINVRVGGILLIAYLGLFMIVSYLVRPELRVQLTQPMKLGRMIGIGVVVVVLAYFAGMLYWPYAQEDPFSGPLTALSEMQNFSTSIRMLFEGDHYWSDELPWYYIPKWILISAPLFMLIGFVLSVILFVLNVKKMDWLSYAFIAFTAVFPVAYAVAKGSSLYDGMRHFLFIYPMLVVLAAWGWGKLIEMSNPAIRWGGSAVLFGLAILPALFMMRNHPNQYVYFNELAGGAEAAYGRYEMDYWMNSAKEVSEWLVENDPRIKSGEEIIIRTNCFDPVTYYMKKLAPNVRVGYTRYSNRAQYGADYLIFINRFVNKDLLTGGHWPPNEVIYKVEVDGATIGAISKTGSQYGNQAWKAQKENNVQEAIRLNILETQEHPKNETAWLGLANLYMNTQQYDKAKEALDQLFTLTQSYTNGLLTMAQYHVQKQQIPEAKANLEKLRDVNYKYSPTYLYLTSIYAQEGKMAEALQAAMSYDEHGGNSTQIHDIGIQAAQQLGRRAELLYLQSKKAFFAQNYQESFNLVTQALRVDPDMEQALALKKVFDDSQKQ